MRDPTIQEMRAFLDRHMGQFEAEEFDREEAIYWFAADWHSGMSSNLYSALSQSEFRPGPLAREPENTGRELYAMLEAEYTDHPRRGR